MSNNSSQSNLVIDQAARATRSTRVPVGPPAEVVERVRRLAPATPRRQRRWFAAFSVAAAVLLATGLFTLPKFGNGGGVASGFAFADVIVALGNVQTVTYREVIEQTNGDRYASRETVAMDGKYSRSEMLDENGKMRTWAVYNTGRMLNVDPVEKTASLTDTTTGDGVPHSLADEHTLADLLKIDPAKANPLGERAFAGKKLTGFRVNRDNGRLYPRSVDVWVDPTTKLPVYIEETSSRPEADEAAIKALEENKAKGNEPHGWEALEKVMETWPQIREKRTITDITFNVPVDESTFSIEPPAGFKFTSDRVGN